MRSKGRETIGSDHRPAFFDILDPAGVRAEYEDPKSPRDSDSCDGRRNKAGLMKGPNGTGRVSLGGTRKVYGNGTICGAPLVEHDATIKPMF